MNFCTLTSSLCTKCLTLCLLLDYKAWLEPHIDKDIANWAKLEDTQLVWKFEQVPICASFPLGVKTMYRAYSQDKVFEIKNAEPPFKSPIAQLLSESA